MDTEQLRTVVELVAQLGGDAQEAFIVYIVVMGLAPCVNGLFTLVGVLSGLWLVSRLIRQCFKLINTGTRAAGALGLSGGCFRERESAIFVDYVREHKVDILARLDKE